MRIYLKFEIGKVNNGGLEIGFSFASSVRFLTDINVCFTRNEAIEDKCDTNQETILKDLEMLKKNMKKSNLDASASIKPINLIADGHLKFTRPATFWIDDLELNFCSDKVTVSYYIYESDETQSIPKTSKIDNVNTNVPNKPAGSDTLD